MPIRVQADEVGVHLAVDRLVDDLRREVVRDELGDVTVLHGHVRPFGHAVLIVGEIGIIGLVVGDLRIAQAGVHAVERDVEGIARPPLDRAGQRRPLLAVDDRAVLDAAQADRGHRPGRRIGIRRRRRRPYAGTVGIVGRVVERIGCGTSCRSRPRRSGCRVCRRRWYR